MLSEPIVYGDNDEPELRYRALVALKKEVLPRAKPQRIWGGSGCGDLCPVCGSSVQPTDIEMEVEFSHADGSDAAHEFHMHLRCFTAWEDVKKSLLRDRE